MSKDTVIRERESKTDIAYRVMLKKKKERSFYDLWEDVKAELVKLYGEESIENIDEDISFFYTNLTLDGRFVNVGDNKWNLRERVTFDKVHIDMNEIYNDEEEVSEDEDVKDGKININTADIDLLQTINGVGESLASKIIDYRKQNGKFKSVEDLKNVSGIGDKKFEDIKDKVIVK